MATKPISTFVPIEVYEGDPDLFNHYEYVDGALIEKPVPTWKHNYRLVRNCTVKYVKPPGGCQM
jgi:Uma2 family endonuclease